QVDPVQLLHKYLFRNKLFPYVFLRRLLLHPFARCGDRWTLPSGSIRPDRLLLDSSWTVILEPDALLHIESPDGKKIEARFDADSPSFLFAKKTILPPCHTLELAQE